MFGYLVNASVLKSEVSTAFCSAVKKYLSPPPPPILIRQILYYSAYLTAMASLLTSVLNRIAYLLYLEINGLVHWSQNNRHLLCEVETNVSNSNGGRRSPLTIGFGRILIFNICRDRAQISVLVLPGNNDI